MKALNIGKSFGIKFIMSEKYEIFSAAFSANSLRATGFKSTHYALAELIDNSIQSALEDKKSKNWLEIMGCGLVHPNVIDMAGLDSKKFSVRT